MGHNSNALIFAALIIGVALYLSKTTIDNVNDNTLTADQTNDQQQSNTDGAAGGGGASSAISGLASLAALF